MESRGLTVLQTLISRYIRVCVCYTRNFSKVDEKEIHLHLSVFFLLSFYLCVVLLKTLIPGTHKRWPVPPPQAVALAFKFLMLWRWHCNFLAFILILISVKKINWHQEIPSFICFNFESKIIFLPSHLMKVYSK